MYYSVKDLFRVLSANVISLLIGIVNGFVVPRFLGLEQYALLKTFTLYASYSGVMQFGFSTGLHLRYGGVSFTSLNKERLKAEYFFLILILSISSFIIMLLGAVVKDPLIICLSLYIIPINSLTFFKAVFQATGSFKQYSRLNVLHPVIHLLGVLLIVLVLMKKDALFFIAAELIAVYLVSLTALSISGLFLVRMSSIFSRDRIQDLRAGFLVMLGNLSSIFFYSMDRWFVKLFLRNEEFAFYSFATSMMNMVMILISSVSMTFYPMLVRRHQEEILVRTLKSYLLILGAFAGVAYFAFDFVVRWILTDYIPSLEVIEILFAGFPAVGVINAIYVNMYKAQKVEKKYFFTVFGIMAISFGLNALAVIISKSNWTIAAATTIAFYFWFFFSSKDFNGARTNLREISYLVSFLLVFFSTTRLFSWWIGLPLYLAGILGISLLFYKQEFLDLTRKVLGAFKIRTSQN